MDLNKLNRENVKVVDDDLATVLAATIADYEQRSGKVLQPAHIERLLINTFAYRETLARQQMNEAYRQQHPRFATGLMLDLCGDDVNTPRLAAQPALTTLRFSADITGNAQVFIAAGARVAVGDVVFATREGGTLSARQKQVDLLAACTVPGIAGNGWSAGQINTVVDSLHPTIAVKAANITVPSGGVDIEGDDAYRQRILLAPESFSVAGPVGAYQYWARQVSPAIVDVHVANDTDTKGAPIGGTVAVSILTKDGLPGDELLGEVQTALSAERLRPLCDKIVVRAPAPVNYSVNATLTLLNGSNPAEVLAAANAAWAAYEAGRRHRLGADIVPLDIQAALRVAGVYNVSTPGLALTTVAANQWARCTRITITAASEQVDG